MVQTVSARRVLIGVIALYAILLQEFGVSAVPAAVFESFGIIICSQDASAASAPAKNFHRHHGICCILTCAASGFAPYVAIGIAVALALFLLSSLVFASTQERTARSPLRFFFSARGPPQSIRQRKACCIFQT
jgi:hypothetical protein